MDRKRRKNAKNLLYIFIFSYFFNNLYFCIYQPKKKEKGAHLYFLQGEIKASIPHILQKHLKKAQKSKDFVTCDEPHFFFVFFNFVTLHNFF